MIVTDNLKKFFKKYFVFFLLIILVAGSQLWLLNSHLMYGFSDVDWGFLAVYRGFKQAEPNIILNIINSLKHWSVYTHQVYYIGLQGEFFDLNFQSFQIATHVFKTLATIATFPLFLLITGSTGVAFVSTLLFAFAYPAVGTMYTVVTSNDYLAIIFMDLFLWLYFFIVRNNRSEFILQILLLVMMLVTLFLSTERMYPILFLVAATEIFLVFHRKFSKSYLKSALRRNIALFSPVLIVLMYKSGIFLDFLSGNGRDLLKMIQAGNWNLLLTPFIVQGSIILPHDYTKYLGVAKMDNFLSFLDFLLSGPYIVFVITTTLIGLLLFKKPLKFILETMLLTTLFSVVLYITGSHFVTHLISIESITQALMGFYILALSIVSFRYWLKEKDRLLIGLFLGSFFSYIYIFLTWFGASPPDIFSGTHRYLTVPALFMSLFMGCLFVLVIKKLGSLKYLKVLTILPVILLVIFLNINALEIKDFFNGQLRNGFGAEDKQLMRGQLLSHLNNINTDQPSLIYFDFMEDKQNGYYYDNTLMGGLGSWILWQKDINFNHNLVPASFWNDYPRLLAAKTVKDGDTGIYVYSHFYPLSHFYAFKLKDKKVIDIRENILKEMRIENTN